MIVVRSRELTIPLRQMSESSRPGRRVRPTLSTLETYRMERPHAVS